MRAEAAGNYRSLRGQGAARDDGEKDTCTGAYDARYIGSVLVYLRGKAHCLDAAGRAALLERASRLPGLGGRFIEHGGDIAFRPVAADHG